MRYTLWGATQFAALDAYLIKHWQDKADDKKPLVVTVAEYDETRRTKQNDRYWAVLTEFAEFAKNHGQAFSVEVWHEHFKREFIGFVELPSGQVMAKSSARLGVKVFAEYSEKVEAWLATEMGFCSNYEGGRYD